MYTVHKVSAMTTMQDWCIIMCKVSIMMTILVSESAHVL